MCLIVFSYKQYEKFPLIFAGNRDEFYDRPARPAQFWNTYPGLLAGKDLKADGTWLGVTNKGDFGALTNYRDLTNIRDDAPTRGKVVTGLLTGHQNAEQYFSGLRKEAHRYNGFNLLGGNLKRLLYLSSQTSGVQSLSPGLYGISNALLDTPWPKVKSAKKQFAGLLGNDTVDEEGIFEMLTDDTRYPREQLPDTGLDDEMEVAVSSIFIRTENYGTRCSTLFYITADRKCTFIERTYPKGSIDDSETVRFNFGIDS